MRKPIVAGNWKMNNTLAESRALTAGIVEAVASHDAPDIVIAPTAISLAGVGELLGDSNVELAAQNMHWAAGGAYTGEVSAAMIKDAGCTWVILGHSERRQYFGESDEGVNHKAHVALGADLTPIICVGETLEEREAERTVQKIELQVRAALAGIDQADASRVVIAYEPIWAIGTGKTASAEQAQEIHLAIRNIVADIYGRQIADQMRILYGGSVKPGNIAELIAQPDLDGALIGGASLRTDSFAEIAQVVDDYAR
jgi:triosephosphate isomerase